MNQNLVDLQNLKKEFDGTPVLRGISLSIKRREFVTLLGPSGCGKTTTLRIIGGFEQPDSGDVFFDGKRLNDVPPYQREINTVFQRYALFPAPECCGEYCIRVCTSKSWTAQTSSAKPQKCSS